MHLQYKTISTSFGHSSANFYDKHIFFNRGLYILAITLVEITLCCITSNRKREKILKHRPPFNTKSPLQCSVIS